MQLVLYYSSRHLRVLKRLRETTTTSARLVVFLYVISRVRRCRSAGSECVRAAKNAPAGVCCGHLRD